MQSLQNTKPLPKYHQLSDVAHNQHRRSLHSKHVSTFNFFFHVAYHVKILDAEYLTYLFVTNFINKRVPCRFDSYVNRIILCIPFQSHDLKYE